MDEQIEDVNELDDEKFLKALEEAEYEGRPSESDEDEIEGEEDTSGDVDGDNEADEDSSEEDVAADEEGSDEDDNADTSDEEDNDDEDTDQLDDADEDASDEDDTNDGDDGDDQDTSDDEEDADDDSGEENTQVNDGDDSSDTDEGDDESSTDTDTTDYKKQYEDLVESSKTLQAFHDEVTSEFIANGKKVKGFTDPKKIIQSQQMAYGYSDKMAAFKKYRPLMGPMKDRGMLEDPEKFNLMMDLYDGNVEAIKSHIKKLEIDPIDLDMDTIAYKGKNHVTSPIEIALNDVMDNAANSGVKDQIERVVREQWDPDSVVELLNNPTASADIVEHMSTGVFEAVQDRINEKKLTDVVGTFDAKPSIQQYREALAELNTEYTTQQKTVQDAKDAEEVVKAATKADAVEVEKLKIENERKATKYKNKAEQEKLKADQARKKATTVSKKKQTTKTSKKVIDPMDLPDADFNALVDGFIN